MKKVQKRMESVAKNLFVQRIKEELHAQPSTLLLLPGEVLALVEASMYSSCSLGGRILPAVCRALHSNLPNRKFSLVDRQVQHHVLPRLWELWPGAMFALSAVGRFGVSKGLGGNLAI